MSAESVLRCDEVRLLLDDLLDGELRGSVMRDVEAHLRGCQACTGLFRAMKDTDTILSTTFPVTPPRGLDARLVARLLAERRPVEAPPARWERPVVALSAVLFGLALTLGRDSIATLWAEFVQPSGPGNAFGALLEFGAPLPALASARLPVSAWVANAEQLLVGLGTGLTGVALALVAVQILGSAGLLFRNDRDGKRRA